MTALIHLSLKQNPLERLDIMKTSGSCPTRNSYFIENEWVKTHSKSIFCLKRVGAAAVYL